MILPAQWILKHGTSLIDPFDSANINPASYDVTLARDILVRGGDKFQLPMRFMPNEFIIATTNEYFRFPLDVAGDMRLKSSIGRMGVNHVLSVWFDPGFEGEATLELQNVSGVPVELVPGMKIAQMVFQRLEEPTTLSYASTGRYCGQRGPTPVRGERVDKAYL
jgi:deoxycytidine triphosphate deaminase